MKYFLDTEFIEGFHKPLFGKRRHFIDLISIGIVCEDGSSLYLISNEYEYKKADQWVRENVLLPLYKKTVIGDARNSLTIENFHHYFGLSNASIRENLLDFFGCYRDELFCRAPNNIEVYGYYSDYDWVLFCSLFGRMIDLPEGFPMLCFDLKQKMYERGLTKGWKDAYCPDPEGAHDALTDARWNKKLYDEIERFDKIRPEIDKSLLDK